MQETVPETQPDTASVGYNPAQIINCFEQPDSRKKTKKTKTTSRGGAKSVFSHSSSWSYRDRTDRRLFFSLLFLPRSLSPSHTRTHKSRCQLREDQSGARAAAAETDGWMDGSVHLSSPPWTTTTTMSTSTFTTQQQLRRASTLARWQVHTLNFFPSS